MSGDNSFSVKDKRFSAGGADEPTSQDSPAVGDTTPTAEKKIPTPPINFSTFVLSLSTSAAMNLGGYQDPVSGHIPRNLELAKQSIDILGIIHSKTKGNLSPDEAALLESALYELRLQYVEEMKKGA